MPIQRKHKLWNLLGLVIWGDIGDTTMYRSRFKRVVIFTKTWPKKPPSEPQAIQRNRLTQAAARWKALPPEAKQLWDRAAKAASLTMTGYNLFLYDQLTPAPNSTDTIFRQTRTQKP